MNKEDKLKAQAFADAIDDTIKATKRIHPGYIEWQKAKPYFRKLIKKSEGQSDVEFAHNFLNNPLFGKYQIWYRNSVGDISAIQVRDYTNALKWEIYDGDKLFDDCIRFKNKKEMEKAVCKYLKGEIKYGKA